MCGSCFIFGNWGPLSPGGLGDISDSLRDMSCCGGRAERERRREGLVSRNDSGRRSSLNVLLHFSLSPLRKIKDTHTHRQTDTRGR
jgi:hypothetical protein